jgi:hypothetical protein
MAGGTPANLAAPAMQIEFAGQPGKPPNSVEQSVGFRLQSRVRAQGSPATGGPLVMKGNRGFPLILSFLQVGIG